MIRIKEMLKYETYYDYETKTVYIRDKVKVRDLHDIRVWLIDNGYYFKNIIIGRPDL